MKVLFQHVYPAFLFCAILNYRIFSFEPPVLGKRVHFTVPEDKTVIFQHGNKTHGLYKANMNLKGRRQEDGLCNNSEFAGGTQMLRPKEVVCKWVDAFNNHDVEAIVSLYHDNATNHQVTNDPVIGVEAIREMFTAEFATADMTAIVENIFEDGQWAILEWKDPLGLRGCGFFQVVNGKILFQRGYWDKLSFLKQHNLPIE